MNCLPRNRKYLFRNASYRVQTPQKNKLEKEEEGGGGEEEETFSLFQLCVFFIVDNTSIIILISHLLLCCCVFTPRIRSLMTRWWWRWRWRRTVSKLCPSWILRLLFFAFSWSIHFLQNISFLFSWLKLKVFEGMPPNNTDDVLALHFPSFVSFYSFFLFTFLLPFFLLFLFYFVSFSHM